MKSLQPLDSPVCASIHDPNHHCIDLLTKLTYKEKETLFTFARNCEETYAIDMKIPKAQKILRTKFVESTVRNSEPNRLLHAIPCVTPEKVDRGEAGFSGKETVFLSQMRSSYCPLLGDFRKKINSDKPDTCRKCHKERKTAAHVFECIGGIKCKNLRQSTESLFSRLGEILA